ncbi:hypothetical protein CAEBREN_04216 [Caenorhabditis brenneri]|uniref:Serpentine Receptor, class H n=1 Tax=Caenorhabditis brenneri TaxID=135651 RepID=G0M9F9_CAEBE|nr:hypothetical protein CAEBREN_04216 [Caenorhabditis brenneri]
MPAKCSPSSHDLTDPEVYKRVCHIMTCIVIPFHLYGAWCILFKTSTTMMSVRKLLLWGHFLIVLLDLEINFLSVFYVLFPTFSGYSLGVVNNPPIEVFGTLTTMAYVATSILGIFENRYFIIFAQNTIWRRIRRPYLVVNYFLAAIVFLPLVSNIPDQEEGIREVSNTLPCTPEININNRHLFVLTLDFRLPFFCLAFETVFLAVQIITFSVVTFLKLRERDRRTSCNMSRKTQNSQKNFVMALCFQTSVPIILLLTPALYVLITMLLNYYNQYLTNFIFLTAASHGIFSTIVMVFVHQPYRNATFQLFSCSGYRQNRRLGRSRKVSVVDTSARELRE